MAIQDTGVIATGVKPVLSPETVEKP